MPGVRDQPVPAELLGEIRSQVAINTPWVISPKPKALQVGSEHSTMKVAVSASNW